MRSRPARLISTALALLAFAAAGYYLFTTEQTIAERRTTVRAFEQYARDATRQLGDARTALLAYVSAGQDIGYWTPKLAAVVQESGTSVDGLRRTASSDEARKTLIDVTAAVTELGNIDKRAREYLTADQPLMASDVVFSEGVQTAAEAGAGVEAARIAERQALEGDERAERRVEVYVLAGCAACVVLLMLGLALTTWPAAAGDSSQGTAGTGLGLSGQTPASAPAPAMLAPPDAFQANGRALEIAADLSHAFAQVQDFAGLQAVIGRIATAIDATGVVVWLGSATGDDLRPVLAHGYSDKVIQMLPPVPVTADNAAAAAYRSGTLQIIPERPGTSVGALVAPLISADGCIGALAAEIRKGGERSSHIQSLATIFASQLAGVLATSTQAVGSSRAQSR